MKKRRKAKERKQKQRSLSLTASSVPGLIRRAREFPIHECLINPDWDEEDGGGLARILLSRRQTDGRILFGAYLVDVYCLGLKNTWCNANFSPGEYRRDVVERLYFDVEPKECPVDLAHQIIYQAIDYAGRFGFRPQKDFKWSQHILEKRGALTEPYRLSFGRDGKPFYISGPDDNVKVIIARLEKNPGPGNYDYLIELGDPFEDDEFGNDDMEE